MIETVAVLAQPKHLVGAPTHAPLAVFHVSAATLDETRAIGLTRSPVHVWEVVLTAMVALIVLVFGLKEPAYNWDMIGYVAVALSADGHHGANLNKTTYDSVRSEVGAGTFDRLTQGDYRQTVFRDPSSLTQQLPLYRTRVLYVESTRMLHVLGLGYPKSTYVVSAVFAALSVVLLAFVGHEFGAPVVAVPVVVACSGFADIASLSTPDAMACFFSLLTMYALIRKSRLVFVVAGLLPLVRTDFLLLSLLVLGHTFIVGQRKRAVVATLAACTLYWLLVKLNGAYDWLTLFNTSLIHKSAYPSTLIPSHSFGDYLRPYAAMAYDFTMRPHFVIYALALWLLTRRGTRAPFWDMHLRSALFIIPMAFVTIHLLLFPAITYRFFVFAAAIVATGLLSGIAAQSSAARSASEDPAMESAALKSKNPE